MITLTGATGHIGNVLVRELLSRGENVRVLILDNEDRTSLNGLNVETVTGDVCNKKSLEAAFRGADRVYHLAGIISILPGKKKLLNLVNVNGTKNVIDVCLKTGIRRLVYVSSIHAVKEPPHGTIITETCPPDPLSVLGDYAKSKALATCEVLNAVKAGLDAVIVCPTGVIGPYDFRVSEMGQLILDFMNRKLKASVNGAYDFVDVRDVAKGIILAGENGRSGETYILSGEQIKISCLMSLLESVTGIKAPGFVAPLWLARVIGVMATPYYRLKKTKPLFTAYSIDVLASNSLVSSEKARKELGFTTRLLKESLEDAVNWFRENKIRDQSTGIKSKLCTA